MVTLATENLDACGLSNSEEEAVTKTYAVHAVVDVKTKKRLSFREAIDQNIFEPDDGSYLNTATGEKLYVGDAIRKGLIKVTFIAFTHFLSTSLYVSIRGAY